MYSAFIKSLLFFEYFTHTFQFQNFICLGLPQSTVATKPLSIKNLNQLVNYYYFVDWLKGVWT